MKYAIGFVLGAAAGSLVTWKIIEKKYKSLADEEIASVIERYKNKNKHNEGPREGIKEEKTTEVEIYKDMLKDMDYTADNDYTVYTEPLKEIVLPFVISPDDFGDTHGYDTKSWTYYADFVVTDENDEIITDPESIIGDALEHFDEYADGAVYVRNDEQECDYEILRHDRPYSEVFKDNY